MATPQPTRNFYCPIPLLAADHPAIRAYPEANPHCGCDHEGRDGVPWCMWDQATWTSSFDRTSREQVRRAKLQGQIELSMAKKVNDYMGTNGAFRAYQRVCRLWDEVK
jgi:hypothetical protein